MPDYCEDDIRRNGLYEKLIFIVGNARSGTTIVANILNLSESIYVMEEANLFIHLTRPDFPQWFNAMHRDLGHAPRKGRYVPPFQGDGETGLVTLRQLLLHAINHLRHHIRFVADKRAAMTTP